MIAPMSAFGLELFNLGCTITRCRDLDRAMPDFVRQWKDDELLQLAAVEIGAETPWGHDNDL